jgi:hypothetical protein
LPEHGCTIVYRTIIEFVARDTFIVGASAGVPFGIKLEFSPKMACNCPTDFALPNGRHVLIANRLAQ